MIAAVELDDARALEEACQRDPDFFSREVLGRMRWEAQLEMRRAIWGHRRVLVHSANGVGKTYDLAGIVIEWLERNPGGRVICTGPTFDQVRAGLWSEVRKAYMACEARGLPLGGRMGASSWVIMDGWDAAVASVTNISAIQGRRGAKVLIVVDEAQGVDNGELWDALESLMTADDSRMVVSGNPLKPSGRFFEYASNPDWYAIVIDGLSHPNVIEGREIIPGAITKTWVDERRRLWGEDDPRWQARVRGQFPTEGVNQVVSLGMLEAAKDGVKNVEPEERRAGLDVAREGNDSCYLTVFDEYRRLIHVESWRHKSLMETAGRAKNALAQWKVPAKRMGVDAIGMGAGVVDRLREQGIRVNPVKVSEGQKNRWKGLVGREAAFKNHRAELHWVVRRLLQEKALSIPKRFRQVWADLTVATYTFDGQGRIQIERKDEIKKRIGRSPDAGDAVMLAFSANRTSIRGGLEMVA